MYSLIKKLLFFVATSLAFAQTATAEYQVKVAIIDTGLDLTDPRFAKVLCKDGHKDFTGEGLKDLDGHGTHVAGLIKKYAGKVNYCIIIYKYYTQKAQSLSLSRSIASIEEAIKNGANVINYSSGGVEFNESEYLLIKNHPGILFVVAAGNSGKNLDSPDKRYFPASYRLPNIVAVGNLTKDGKRSYKSNYASFLTWEMGTDVLSTFPCSINPSCEGIESGSSMATAIKTGKILSTYK